MTDPTAPIGQSSSGGAQDPAAAVVPAQAAPSPLAELTALLPSEPPVAAVPSPDVVVPPVQDIAPPVEAAPAVTDAPAAEIPPAQEPPAATEPVVAEPVAAPVAPAPDGLPPPPAVIPGPELYDQIMQYIDPELTTTGLTALEEKYRDETPEQSRARAERYKAAFAEYERRFAAYGAQWLEEFTRYQRQALATLEHSDREADDKVMSDMESQIAGVGGPNGFVMPPPAPSLP